MLPLIWPQALPTMRPQALPTMQPQALPTMRPPALLRGIALGCLLLAQGMLFPSVAQGDAPVHPTAEWRFEPLGPEGADIREIFPLARGRALARTARDELILWAPPAQGFGDGAWQRLPLPRQYAIQRVQVSPCGAVDQTVLILLSNGALLGWLPDAPLQGVPVWPRQADPYSDERSLIHREFVDSLGLGVMGGVDAQSVIGFPEEDYSWGEFGLIGWVPPDVARRAVALIPAEGKSSQGALLLMRDGAVWEIHQDGTWERWRARFEYPGSEQMPVGPSLGEDHLDARSSGDDHLNARSPGEDRRPLLREVFMHPSDPSLLLALTEWEGLFVSRDGARSFVAVCGDLPKAVRAVCLKMGRELCAACSEGIFVSGDSGRSWLQAGSVFCQGAKACGDILHLAEAPAGHLLAVTGSGQLLRSIDSGATWQRVLSARPLQVRCLACDLDRSVIWLGTSRGILRSTDTGRTWEWQNRGLRRLSVLSIEVAEGGEALRLDTELGVYVGPAEVGCWSPARAAMPDSSAELLLSPQAMLQCISDQASLPQGRDVLSVDCSGGHIWLGTDAGLYRRATTGTWDLVAFAGERVTAVFSALERPRVLLCRTARGVFWTSDADHSWIEVPIPLQLPAISLAVGPEGRKVFIGTRYGLFVTAPPEPTLLISRPLPIQASPNPFSQQVLLRCNLDASDYVERSGWDGASGHALHHPPSIQTSGTQPEDGNSLSNGSVVCSDFGSEQLESELEIRIISVHGQVVRRLRGSEAVSAPDGGTSLQWTWDGRDERGQEAPNGIYMASTRVGEHSYVGKIVKFR